MRQEQQQNLESTSVQEPVISAADTRQNRQEVEKKFLLKKRRSALELGVTLLSP